MHGQLRLGVRLSAIGLGAISLLDDSAAGGGRGDIRRLHGRPAEACDGGARKAEHGAGSDGPYTNALQGPAVVVRVGGRATGDPGAEAQRDQVRDGEPDDADDSTRLRRACALTHGGHGDAERCAEQVQHEGGDQRDSCSKDRRTPGHQGVCIVPLARTSVAHHALPAAVIAVVGL